MSSKLTLLRLLEQDLRGLSEVRDARKFPEVKEASERALLRLRSISKALSPDASSAEQAAAVARADNEAAVMLVPFMLALASKSDALPLAALGAVQRMISHNAVAPQRLPTVTSQLIARAQLPAADEPSLLKVLQTVLTIASSPAMLHSDTTVSQLLLLCLTLQQSRSNTIRNTASATVQQFVALLLDAVAAEKPVADGAPPIASGTALKPPSPEALAGLSVAARCAFMAVQDLCLLANGEPALWLPGSGPVSVPFAFEVINRTLASHAPLFMSFMPFTFLLRERCCALVLKTMQQPAQEWPVALRLSHLTSTLLANYTRVLRTETEILLSVLSKTAANETAPTWQRVLALEACRVVAVDTALLRQLFEGYDKPTASSSLFAPFTSATCALLKAPSFHFQSRAEPIEALFLASHRVSASARGRTFNVALYSDVDGTQLTTDHVAALAVECQVSIAKAIGTLGEQIRDIDDGEIVTVVTAPDGGIDASGGGREAEVGVVREMVGACWKPLLGALSLLMASFGREEAVQAVLKCYQAFTQACGTLSLNAPRDAFLTSLCHYALPPRPRGTLREASGQISFAPVDTAYEPLPHTRLSAKNVQALKSVFNIAHCMGGLLSSSWSLILDTLEQLDRIIATSKTTAAGGARAVELATAIGGPEATSNELSILSAALNNLFEGSVRLDDAALAHFLSALSTSCFASLAHEATSKEKLGTPGSAAAQPPRLFALTKFVDTVLANLKRIRMLWPLVTHFLLPVANHQTQRIRVLGMESLSRVLIAAMRMHLSERATAAKASADDPTSIPQPPPLSAPPTPTPTTPDRRPSFAVAGERALPEGGAWDRVLLTPLEELQRRCTYRETQERILSATHEVLMTCGAGLGDGWLLLLSILWRAATKPSLVPLLPNAFRSVEVIASDFLPHLPPACLPAYVEVAAAFATQQQHLNVSLTAVGLQWAIGDHCFSSRSRLEADDETEPDAAEEAAEEAAEREAGYALAVQLADVDGTLTEGSVSVRSPGMLAAEAAEAQLAAEEGTGSAHASAARYGELALDQRVRRHDVWCAIMRQLRRLCVDRRPEVRRCTMESFVSIAVSHGGALPGRSLDHLVHRQILPLLTEVIVQANSASCEVSGQKLGTEGGRDVMMMMHHSRDTAAKQWSETWVLALGAAARLYRRFLPQLRRRPRFAEAWDGLLAVLQTSLLAQKPGSQEVPLAAISASHTLLLSSSARAPGHSRANSTTAPDVLSAAPPAPAQPAIPVAAPLSPPSGRGGGAAMQTSAPTQTENGMWTSPSASGHAAERERLPPRLWASVWALLEKAVEVATADASSFATHQKMLCALLSRTAELYDGGRPFFEEADVLRMLQLTERLARAPHAPTGWDPTIAAVTPTPLQAAVLGLLGKLPPFHAESVRADEMWPLLLWLLLKLIEPPPAQPPALAAAEGHAPAAAATPPATPVKGVGGQTPSTPGRRQVTGFPEKCYELLHSLLTEHAGPNAKLAVAEDVLHVMRSLMSWRLHPACACPSLPRAAAGGFVGVLHALLPHLPQPQEGAARRAHVELIEALWARIAPPATRPPPQRAPGAEGLGGTASGPPIAKPLATPPPLGSLGASASDEDLPPPPPLPTGASADDDLDLEGSTLAAARRVLLSTSMAPALRRRLLQLPCAVLVMPPHAAARRDECWRNAASTLCLLSSKTGYHHAANAAAPAEEGAMTTAAPVTTVADSDGGSACAGLAAPMLVEASAAVLSGWGHMGPAELGELSNARAAQIAHLLALLGNLTLADGVLPPRKGASASAPAAASAIGSSGRRAHLVRLYPQLVECIGQPAHLYASAPLPPSVAEVAAGGRRLLHLVGAECGLE